MEKSYCHQPRMRDAWSMTIPRRTRKTTDSTIDAVAMSLRSGHISGSWRCEEVGRNRLAIDGCKLCERWPESVGNASDAPRMEALVAQVEMRLDDDGRNLIDQRAVRMFVSHAADIINVALRGQPFKC